MGEGAQGQNFKDQSVKILTIHLFKVGVQGQILDFCCFKKQENLESNLGPSYRLKDINSRLKEIKIQNLDRGTSTRPQPRLFSGYPNIVPNYNCLLFKG